MARAFGARGVGLGRPFLWAQSAYGEKGVIRTIRSESTASRPRARADVRSLGERDCHGDASVGCDAVGSGWAAARRVPQGDLEVEVLTEQKKMSRGGCMQ